MNLLELLGGILPVGQAQNKRRAAGQEFMRNTANEPTVPDGYVRFEDGSVGRAYPNQNMRSRMQNEQSRTDGIVGAINPLFRQNRTGQASIYSPGDGPRTRF